MTWPDMKPAAIQNNNLQIFLQMFGDIWLK